MKLGAALQMPPSEGWLKENYKLPLRLCETPPLVILSPLRLCETPPLVRGGAFDAAQLDGIANAAKFGKPLQIYICKQPRAEAQG